MKKALIIIAVLAVIGGVVYLMMAPGKPGKYDTFAQCLKDSGTKFYGAFWCPHCRAQKAAFGKSAKLLPYIECSTPDAQGMLPVCQDAGIKGFPTWEYPDGSRQEGEVPLATLAEKTKCALPQ